MGNRMAALLGETPNAPFTWRRFALRCAKTATASALIWHGPFAAMTGMGCTAYMQRAWPRSPVKRARLAARTGSHREHTNIEGRHLGLRGTAVGTRSNARREAIVCSLKAGAKCHDVGGREAATTHVCAWFTRLIQSTKDSAGARTHPQPLCAFCQKEGSECRGAGIMRKYE